MNKLFSIPTSRIEAFSDGVIAILITIMVFDLKVNEPLLEENFWSSLESMILKFLAYGVSFLMLAILWVNHHQLFHQIRESDRPLLWYNIHLLFWMSLIPFGTNLIGSNPMLWQATSFYNLIFLMNSWSFSRLRSYVNQKNLLHEVVSPKAQKRILQKNKIAQAVYLGAALLSPVSVYLSFGLLLLVTSMYFIPEKITSNANQP